MVPLSDLRDHGWSGGRQSSALWRHGRTPERHLKLKRTKIDNVPRDAHHESQRKRLRLIGTRNAHTALDVETKKFGTR
jgi:hypothetical protein